MNQALELALRCFPGKGGNPWRSPSLRFKILIGITFWSEARKFSESAFSIQTPTFFPPESLLWVLGASNLLPDSHEVLPNWPLCDEAPAGFSKMRISQAGLLFHRRRLWWQKSLPQASAIRKSYGQRKIHTNLRLTLITDQAPSL